MRRDGQRDGRTDGLLAMTRIEQDFRTGFAKAPRMNQTFISEYTTSKKNVDFPSDSNIIFMLFNESVPAAYVK